MTRGRRPADADEFEVNPANKNEYRCLLCRAYSPAVNAASWIKKKGWGKHKQTQVHQESLAQRHEDESGIASLELGLDEAQFLNLDGAMSTGAIFDFREPRVSVDVPGDIAVGESRMWNDFDSGHYKIKIEDPEQLQRQRLRDFERRVQEFNLWAGVEELPQDISVDIEAAETSQDEQDDAAALHEILEATGVSEMDGLTNLYREAGLLPADANWSPYPSKLLFLLDAIDNMPRLRVSVGLMNVILWLLREAGVRDVPTATSFRKMQESLRKEKGVETVHWTSPKGNAFSFNSPTDIIANDWTNPEVRRHIRRYPVLPKDGVVSEIWHGEKWQRTLDRHALSPMFDNGQRHYYIDEPARMKDGTIVIPLRWFEDDSQNVWFTAWNVEFDDQNIGTIIDDDSKVVLLEANQLQENILDLQDHREIPMWSEATVAAGHPERMPNPDRALSEEQFQGVKDIIESTHKKPVRIFDPLTNQHMRLKLQCNCGPGDNPAQSEASGHIGGGGNFPCRKCMVGGTTKDKSTDDGFHDFFKPGVLRSVDNTLSNVKEQVRAACKGVAATVTKRQKETGVKDSYTQYWIERLIEWSRERQKRGDRLSLDKIETELMSFVDAHLDAVYNPFLTLKYCDITQDTPVEILHTVLLGVVKYSWHGTHTLWKDAEKSLYSSRLQSTDTKGLSIPAIRAGYIMQYANSLIGRQFRILVQTNTFHVHDLVSKDQYQFIKAVGVLAALLWVPEIQNMDEYLSDVETAIANVLDSAALIDPSKLITKIKYHLLTHAVDDIKRVGPLIGVATESYESFNTIFRYCSILSNHLAPSRDIAYQLAKQETFKHLMSGGWWKEADGSWKQAGASLQQYVKGNIMLNRLFNIKAASGHKEPVGHTVLAPMPPKQPNSPLVARQSYHLHETEAHDAVVHNRDFQRPELTWFKCKSIIASSGDECRVGSWVISRRLEQHHTITLIGRIVEILRTEDGRYSLAVIERFQVSQALHPIFEMPVLMRPFNEASKIAIGAQDIIFDFNAQHDCYTAKCVASGKRALKQERIDSGKIEVFVEHQPVERFVINTHAFHNAHRLRSVAALREHLKPKLLYPDRTQHHREAALVLREAKVVAEPEDSEVQPTKKRKRTTKTTQPAVGEHLSLAPAPSTQSTPSQLGSLPMEM
ncbi:hypothetical protein EST38_g10696 [Candolleomyces aberdarensis]|uniref:Uncharacterized protein n=1 Tax=Candolleomyces aberdarensis TaxID=2316362 RepID=A0A4Q2D6Q7_9AGAR|nr:hypothetical protein EST38_g10696 [Candolleomyces aberdarensis]